jgi:hypothetical protein
VGSIPISVAIPQIAQGRIEEGALESAHGDLVGDRLASKRLELWPKETTDVEEETFDLVVFSSYKVEERAPYLGETRAWIGDAAWKPIDRASVEVLVGGKV